jgi:hypothetical protein
MKSKGPIKSDITSTPFKKKKDETAVPNEHDRIDSTTPDPTQPDTEITYNKKHEIGDPIKKNKAPHK